MSYPALAGVAWPGVFDTLGQDTPDDLRETVFWYAHRARYPDGLHAAFAVLVTHSGWRQLTTALRAHGAADPEQLACWLCAAAQTVLHPARYAPEGEAVPLVDLPDGDGPLRVDPALPALPHLQLAEQLAARVGLLAVVRRDVQPLIGGCAMRHGRARTADGDTIETALILLRDPAVFAHELGHLLDPRQTHRHPEQAEAFADELAALLRICEPASIAAAQPLIDHADSYAGVKDPAPAGPDVAVDDLDAEPDDPPGPGLPAPGAESLAAFAALPLTSRRP